MIKLPEDLYSHPNSGKTYRKLPDINGDRLANSHEGEAYGTVFEEVVEVSNEWSGWGTQLKPAHEPICLARKPIKGSIRENCLKYGTGALNIDATRVPYENEADKEFIINTSKTFEQTGTKWTTTFDAKDETPDSYTVNQQGRFPSNVLGEIAEPYQKYFYCPKVSRKERHVGLIDPGPMFERPRDENGKPVGEGESMWMDPKVSGPKKIADQPAGTNNHPTVKPIELMKYLIKLVTPAGGTVLDPFNGSGSTGCAAVELGFNYVGIDLDPKYVEISERRIAAWNKGETTFNNLFDE
jgi:site-specific DNA-methyltransferase (adenine-specific)